MRGQRKIRNGEFIASCNKSRSDKKRIDSRAISINIEGNSIRLKIELASYENIIVHFLGKIDYYIEFRIEQKQDQNFHRKNEKN